ncbi:MAG: PBP1A family penicillin-binding protein [Clostridia bacterium]|nr:PBP1A family penicillin-binding protein [Clostridia bacterium]
MAKWDFEKSEKRMNKDMKKRNKAATKRQKPMGCAIVWSFLLIGLFAGLGVAVAIIVGILTDSPTINIEDYQIKNISTVFYDRDGKETDTAHGGENRTIEYLDKIPKYLQDAFISIEDERFYEHNGVDLQRTAGAIWGFIRTFGKGTYGGSTITQQLVKNMTQDKADEGLEGVLRKVREWWRATMIERELSKDQILELYLNTVYFGNSTYGVKEAANLYFSKETSDLTLAESALLAGVPNRPVKYDPFTNLENAKARQKVILGKMKELGKITEAEYQAALEEEIVIKRGLNSTGSSHSWFIDAVIEDVIKDLQEKKGMTKVSASNLIYGGGLKIYTTMDSKVQAAMDQVFVTEDATMFKAFANKEEQPQAAMVVEDYKTGHILGIVGGRGEKTSKREFNRTTQAYRQPGSTIKPLAIYGPAIEDKIITAATIISDTPLTIEIPGSKPWSPTNWYGSYYGNVTVRYAIEQSMNVPAARVLQMIGLNRAYQALEEEGITTLQKEDLNYAPLSLGGLNKGVTVREWTGAYGMIANGGIYNQPITYTKVEDANGTIILQNKRKEKRVFSSGTAYVLTDIMKGVITKGTARSARLENSVAAGKTGSTTGTKDKWFVGYTPYYVAAVWFGYDEPKVMDVGGEVGKQIWKKVMDILHKDLPSIDFSIPEDVQQIGICSVSGKRTTSYCSGYGKNEWFVKGSEPTGYCTYHSAPSYYPEGI